MIKTSCPTYVALVTEVNAVLEKLTNLTQAQLDAFKSDRRSDFMRLDKELENTVGLKERVVGALRQHEAEHHCQS